LIFHILQYHMKKYTKMIINKMKEEKLFASQGGPIILSQVWFHSKKILYPCRRSYHLIDLNVNDL
jgi:hypothetical protein